jgi:hypothetical protein
VPVRAFSIAGLLRSDEPYVLVKLDQARAMCALPGLIVYAAGRDAS